MQESHLLPLTECGCKGSVIFSNTQEICRLFCCFLELLHVDTKTLKDNLRQVVYKSHFCVLLYIIVVLNTQRLGAFVLNIGPFCGNEDIYDMWKLQYYKHFRVGVFS